MKKKSPSIAYSYKTYDTELELNSVDKGAEKIAKILVKFGICSIQKEYKQ